MRVQPEDPARPRRARISDVAAAAGVSTTTVSHALSGARAVNQQTRQRILEVAAELGYTPDRVATGLRRRRTGTVGFVGDEVASTPFAGKMIASARATALDEDVLMLVAESGGDPANERDAIARLLAQRVDGLILARMYHQRIPQHALPAEVPVVLANAAPALGWDVDWIAPDEAQIAVLAAERILVAGHRRIAYIGTTDESRAARARLVGVRTALGDAGIPLPDDLVALAASDAAGGREAGRELLERHDRPTAIICFNDQLAMGVMQAAARLGLTVPDDLSLIGVDDLPLVADALDPGLTTVALPHAEMGELAMRRLLALIADPDARDEASMQLMPGRLIERGSVAPRR